MINGERDWAISEFDRRANCAPRSSRGETIDRHFPEGKGSSSCNPSSSSLKWSYFDLGFDRVSTRHGTVVSFLPAIEKLTVGNAP